MFTVKHISIDGSENLIAASSVKYDPGAPSFGSTVPGAICSGGRPTALFLDDVPYGGGTFFVMNANGKTVARYNLGASPVPHGVDAMQTSRLTQSMHKSDCAVYNGPALPAGPCDCGLVRAA